MANGIGGGGLPGILSIQPQDWAVYALAMSTAVVVPIVLTIILHKRGLQEGEIEQADEELQAVININEN
jgi:PTS system trehalose-specific IIC component